MYHLLFLFFSLSIVALYFFLIPSTPPICGVYAQPGKFFLLKYFLFRLIYWIRRNVAKIKRGVSAGYGVKSKSEIKEMEKIQELAEWAPLAVDAVYFNASDKRGGYLVAASARRHNNISQTVLIIRIEQLGILELPTMPDTNLKRENEDEQGVYGAGGLVMSCVEPMKKWRITFHGKLRLDGDPDQLVETKLDLKWTSCTDYFDFDTDLNSHALALSMAREPWSRQFFQRLRDSHQTHYEQFGHLKGTLTLLGGKSPRGKLEYKLEMRGARDHSYGNVRQWSHFHRYAMQLVHTQDGSCLNAGVLSAPNALLSRLEFGYLFKDGRKLALRGVHLPIHDLGETTQAPAYYQFEFEDERGERHWVECRVMAKTEFYLGREDKREVVIREQMCQYKVDGVSGWGFSEWQYRHLEYQKPL